MKYYLLVTLCSLIITANAQVDSSTIKYNKQNTPNWVSFSKPSSTSNSNAPSFLQSFLANGNTDISFMLSSSSTDELNIEHQKFEQNYKGLKVYSGEYLVHSKNGLIETANGNYVDVAISNIIPTLTEAQALISALNNINATSYKWQNSVLETKLKQVLNDNNATYYPKGELVIVPKSIANTANDKLCYIFTVAAQNPNITTIILVDAVNGTIIKKADTRCSSNVNGKAQTQYTGNRDIVCNNNLGTYKLEEFDATGTNIKIATKSEDDLHLLYDITNTSTNWDNTWVGSNTTKRAALDAHWGAEMTLKYWQDRHNRSGINPAKPNIPFENHIFFGNPLDGAFYESDPTANYVVYGLGDVNFRPLVALDVCAHEIGHGICEYTAKLSRYGNIETRAINEALSDIWGVCIENFVNTDPVVNLSASQQKNIWLTGEEIVIPAPHFMRSIKDPKIDKGLDPTTGLPIESPDCYLSTTWDNMINTSADPHYANGVMNKWFYILCEGDGLLHTNDVGNDYTVTGIGIKNSAELIVYKAERDYLGSFAQFMDARLATIQAAIDLYGLGSAQEIAVTDAWYAVNVGPKYVPHTPIPCNMGSYTTLPTFINPQTFTGGIYFISNSTYINAGTTTFNDAIIYVQPGAGINVSRNATLNLNGCHIQTCNGLWQGINVAYTGKLSINASASRSSLIEDAVTAVYYDDDNTGASYTGNIISVNNTIFNRNKVGIKIENYTADHNNAIVYPFNIQNNIFTCRRILTNPNGLWNNVATIKGTTPTYPTPQKYTTPYINNTTYPDNIASSYLKDMYTTGYSTNKPQAGIVINNVNNSTATAGIVIGDATTTGLNINIFDNLQYGIKATDANVTINKCAFQKPIGDGVGIFVNESITPTLNYNPSYYINNNFIKINNPSTTAPSNAFYDMNKAISIGNINNVEISGCDIRSNQNINALAQNGKFGISVGDNAFTQIAINDNHIFNVRYPISYGGSHEGERHMYGNLFIENNEIANEISTAPLANSFVEKAITFGVFFEAFTPNTSPILCQGNTITKAFNGIAASGWKARNVSILGNTIELAADALIAPNSSHYGIKMEGGNGSSLDYMDYTLNNNATGNNNDNIIRDNTITGCGITSKNSGIKVALQTNTTIDCNKVYNCQDGFRFYGDCPLTKFTDNFIYFNNQNGVYLDETIIGQQGNDGTVDINELCTSNNDWQQDAATWQGSAKNMIYNFKSTPANSQFVVRGTGKFNPANGGSSFIGGDEYNIGTGLILATASDGSKCYRCTGHPKRIKNIQEILDEIAAGTIELPNDEAIKRLEVMQQQLYELVKAKPELAANSTDIQQFIYDNQWNSLDFIHYLGYFAAQEKMDVVNNILNYWLPTSSVLDDNYRTYYEWLVAMYKNPEYKPSTEEVLAYANKCPIKNGTIIYAIRNLYNALTKEIHHFEDDCESSTQARGTKPKVEMIRLKQPKVKQSITTADNKLIIYPNPVSNILNIATTNIKTVEITDIMGKVVIQKNVSCIGQTNLSVNELQKGIYIIKAINAQGKTLISKFIKE